MSPRTRPATLRHLVVEGPIGVGKTSLARRLAESLGSDILLEDADANPFLPQFYQDPARAALPTQIFFLLQRVRQMQQLRQADLFAPVRVADFLLEKDRLFAELTLTEEELKLYDRLWRELAPEAPAPDLVVYLQAPVPVLRARIARRGLEHEQRMSDSYLERLSEAYVRFFHYYSAAPLLIVNAADMDFVNDEQAYRLLLDRILAPTGARQYFNPGRP